MNSPIDSENRPRVVIIGCGFAGLSAAKQLRDAKVRVTVLDRANHHLFQPLLYQVATAALNPSDVALPIRRILRDQRNVEVLLGEVEAIDPDAKTLRMADGETIRYDRLILATGATHSYFGRDDWAQFAPGLKSIGDALEIRRRILSAFEFAERETDPARRQAWLTFVIVGAGPTGVELAGTLIEVARFTLARDFRRINPQSAQVILVEGTAHVLPAYIPKLSEAARRQLESLGVTVRTDTKVTEIDAEGVTMGDERIDARTVLWAAGVAASPLAAGLGVPLDRAGRVPVLPDLTIPGHPDVYVAGDLAHVESGGALVPGVAPAAMQQGTHAAKNIMRDLAGQPREAFQYQDKGMLATIGRASGVAHIGRLELSGLPAWMLWLLVHIFFLIGFRNRVLVMLQWAWSYLTYDRGARLITGPIDMPKLNAPKRVS
jgi:NADH dehydrogenase